MFTSQCVQSQPDASSSSGDCDGRKNVAEMKSAFARSAFKLHCDHSYPLTLLNVENVVVCHAIRLEPITCQICNRKHHTSAMPLHCLSSQEFHQFMYPGVIVEVQGIKCRALLDTGAGRSYVFAALLDRVSSGK